MFLNLICSGPFSCILTLNLSEDHVIVNVKIASDLVEKTKTVGNQLEKFTSILVTLCSRKGALEGKK